MPQSLNEQLSREQQIAALEKDWAQNPRWKGVKRGYSAADVVRLRGCLQHRAHAGQAWCGKAVEQDQRRRQEGLCERIRRDLRRPGHAAGQGRPGGGVPVGLAGRGRRQHLGNHVPRPVAVRLRLGAHDGAPHQQHLQACRRNPVGPRHQPRRQGIHRLLPAHRRRRRSRFRRRAQCVRTDEEHDRSRALPASTSKTSWRPSRSAATWAARCWCRRRKPAKS